MIKRKEIILFCFFLFVISLCFAETTLVKNASLFLPTSTYQTNSYIIINGAKIERIGLMKELKGGIFDNEYDVEGGFVYPAFIDSFYRGFQKKKSKTEVKRLEMRRHPVKDKTKRKSYEERNYFIKKKVSEELELKQSKLKGLISRGFACVHVVPEGGIIGGTTAVISLVSETLSEAILVPEKFMAVFIKSNSSDYPTTHASIMAEIKQLKMDCFYYQQMKKLQFFHKTERRKFVPELDILHPYFLKKQRFLIKTDNMIQQRMIEILTSELQLNPVLVASPDVWRRPIVPYWDVILPLSFKPPLISKYANLDEKTKKEAEKKIYPKQIAKFFMSRKNIGLTAPDSGDYKELYENIRILIKQGVKEEDIIKSLTLIPAKLLGISRFTGSIQPGKLASIVVSDKKIFEDKARIKRVFVEGKTFDFKKKEGKPPVTDLTGKWIVKFESTKGNFEMKMTIEQEENNISGELLSRMGTIEIEEGFISGKEIDLSMSAPIGGQPTKIEMSGKVMVEGEEKRIEGTMTMGSFGSGTFVAMPENI